MRTGSDIQQLRRIPLLADLPDKDLLDISSVMERRSVRKGQMVLKANEPGCFMMFVVSGRLRVLLSNRSGRELALELLGPGQCFGELALLTGEPRSADIEACEESSIIVLSSEAFEKHVLGDSRLLRTLLRELAQRLRKATLRMGDLALLDVYTRLARVLYSLGEIELVAGVERRVIRARPTHRELAGLVGTSREMVTRALGELQAAGHISIEGKKLIVHSSPA